MKCKIFDCSYGAKVLVIETKEFVEYYIQINSSDWKFCVGCAENFDDVSQVDAELVAEQYYKYCDEEEQVIEKAIATDY